MTNKLYEIKTEGEESTFAVKLAVNSEGLWVMEPKAGGAPFAVDKERVEEVIPHTVDITFIGGNGKLYTYTAPKGLWSVGDIIVMSGQLGDCGPSLAVVVGVDTKRPASKELNPISKVVVDTSFKS